MVMVNAVNQVNDSDRMFMIRVNVMKHVAYSGCRFVVTVDAVSHVGDCAGESAPLHVI